MLLFGKIVLKQHQFIKQENINRDAKIINRNTQDMKCLFQAEDLQ